MLFEGQRFDSDSTALVAWALGWYAVGLAGHSAVEIVSRAYYALHDTRTPVIIGTAAMGANIVLSLLLAPVFTRLGWAPHGGLALANSAATTLEMLALMWLLRRRLNGLDLTRAWPGLARAALATALMGAALWAWLTVSQPYNPWVVGLGGVAVGGAVFAVAAVALRVPEVALVRTMLRRRDSGD
jgi:putative peptidoglycan lipid II flippase